MLAPWRTSVPNCHLGHVTHVYGHAVQLFKHDIADIVQRADQADATDQVLLRMQRQYVAAGIGIVAGDGPVNLPPMSDYNGATGSG